MSLKIFNTLTHKKESFVPLQGKKVGMYVCGPTVYNYIHVGNARPVVFFDVVYRYLQYKGYEVTYVRNITDVDDRIIQRAQSEKKRSAEIARHYEDAFQKDIHLLAVMNPTLSPRATEHVLEMIQWIQQLVGEGIAYQAQGEILFSIEKFPHYGKLSKKNTDDLIAGARVEVSKHKKNPIDFVLWKPTKNIDDPAEPSWDSPWGKGRPGWHIECSVMATKYLGESIDIHGGGVDLIFPHHENEIAQCESYTKKTFVKYWLHNNMLVLGKEKMSKSLGNIITIREFLQKYPAEVLKFILLSNHYRSSLEFSDQVIKESIQSLEKIYKMLEKVKKKIENPIITSYEDRDRKNIEFTLSVDSFWRSFEEYIEDDFNTAGALGSVLSTVRIVNRYFSETQDEVSPAMVETFQKLLNEFEKVSKVLGLFFQSPEFFLKELHDKASVLVTLSKSEIKRLITEREEARQEKNWKKSDEIRDFLKSHNITLEDTPQGTHWKVES